MKIQPDRGRMSQLVAAEMRYFGSPSALSLVVTSTVLVSLVAVLFSAFYYIGEDQSARSRFYFILACCLLGGFILLFLVYRICIRVHGPWYTAAMLFSALCYAVCAASGFVFVRSALLWQLPDLALSAYDRFVRGAFSWSLLLPCAMLVLYFLLLFLFVDRPLPYLGWNRFVYIMLPISILLVIGVCARLCTKSNLYDVVFYFTVAFLSLAFGVALHFIVKAALNRYLVKTAATYETFNKAKHSVPEPGEVKVTAADLIAARRAARAGQLGQAAAAAAEAEPEDAAAAAAEAPEGADTAEEPAAVEPEAQGVTVVESDEPTETPENGETDEADAGVETSAAENDGADTAEPDAAENAEPAETLEHAEPGEADEEAEAPGSADTAEKPAAENGGADTAEPDAAERVEPAETPENGKPGEAEPEAEAPGSADTADEPAAAEPETQDMAAAESDEPAETPENAEPGEAGEEVEASGDADTAEEPEEPAVPQKKIFQANAPIYVYTLPTGYAMALREAPVRDLAAILAPLSRDVTSGTSAQPPAVDTPEAAEPAGETLLDPEEAGLSRRERRRRRKACKKQARRERAQAEAPAGEPQADEADVPAADRPGDSCCDEPDEGTDELHNGREWYADVQHQLRQLAGREAGSAENAAGAESGGEEIAGDPHRPPDNGEPDIVEQLEEPDASAAANRPADAPQEELEEVLEDVELLPPAQGGGENDPH